jgi:hypothetical protein
LNTTDRNDFETGDRDGDHGDRVRQRSDGNRRVERKERIKGET